jgi:hypothetical protein
MRGVPVNAEIRISAGDQVAAYISLWEWLRAERALAGRVQAQYRPPGGEELGGVLDVLTVALGSGGVGVALARSLGAWLQARRSDVRVEVSSRAGSVTVDARRIKDSDVAALLDKVLGTPDSH